MVTYQDDWSYWFGLHLEECSNCRNIDRIEGLDDWKKDDLQQACFERHCQKSEEKAKE